jgi:hypothetical protein
MNSRMNEDLAWLRVQDMQREAENRRLVGGAVASWMATLRRLAAGVVARVGSRRPSTDAVARPRVETRHHA